MQRSLTTSTPRRWNIFDFLKQQQVNNLSISIKLFVTGKGGGGSLQLTITSHKKPAAYTTSPYFTRQQSSCATQDKSLENAGGAVADKTQQLFQKHIILSLLNDGAN